MPMVRFLPMGYISLLFFAFTLALCVGGAPVFIDPDTAWHLAAGDLLRELHWPPLHDSWSFTAREERWYNLSWLFDICFSWIFAKGGFSALYMLTLVAFTGSLMAMVRYCVKAGSNIHAVFIVSLVAIMVMYSGILARPNMVTTVFTVIFYQLLQSYRSTGNFKRLFWLPAIMALWVNMHGGFLLAFAVMGLFLLEAIFERNRFLATGYGFVIAACLVATLVNPYGFELYYGAWRTLSGSFDKTYINEWKAAEIGMQLPITVLLLLTLCIGNAADKRIALVDRMLTVFILLLSLSSIRHSITGVLLMMPYLSQRLSILLYESPYGHAIEAQNATVLRDMEQKDIRIMGGVMATLAIIFITVPQLRDSVLDAPAGFPEDDYPGEEALYIEQHYPHLRFYNDYNLGGYLDYLWRGREKVFVDGRASSLFSADLLKDYSDFSGHSGFGPKAEMIIRQYNLQGLIIPNDNDDAGEWMWHTDWQLVFRGPVASVYIRRDLYDKTSQQNSLSTGHHHEGLVKRLKHALSF